MAIHFIRPAEPWSWNWRKNYSEGKDQISSDYRFKKQNKTKKTHRKGNQIQKYTDSILWPSTVHPQECTNGFLLENQSMWLH